MASSILSSNIKFLRNKSGFTQEQFAERLNIKRSLLGAYEESRAVPKFAVLSNISQIFSISIENLMQQDISSQFFLKTDSSIPVVKPALHDIDKEINTLGGNWQSEPLITKIKESPRPETEKDQFKSNDIKIEVANIPIVELPKNHSNFSGIAYISKLELSSYVQKSVFRPYIESLPRIQFPFIESNNYKAFDSGDDFPLPASILIGNLVDLKNWPGDGHHYFLICKNGTILFRRVFNLSQNKGCLLLSSDSTDISSLELPINQVLEVYQFQYYISSLLPKNQLISPKIRALVEELSKEINIGL